MRMEFGRNKNALIEKLDFDFDLRFDEKQPDMMQGGRAKDFKKPDGTFIKVLYTENGKRDMLDYLAMRRKEVSPFFERFPKLLPMLPEVNAYLDAEEKHWREIETWEVAIAAQKKS